MLKKSLVTASSLFVLSLVAVTVSAQTDLPKAEKVIATYIEKTGGRKTYEAVKNAKFAGEMSVPAQNVKGKVNIVFSAPDKFYFKVDMGGLGQQERGSNGKVVWENSTVQGARIIEGDEAEQLMQELSMGTLLAPEKYYKEMKTTGKESVNGEECYVLALTKKNGDVDKDFYSVKSGLKVKSVRKVETPLGKIEISSFDSNYKKANNGITSAWTSEQKFGPNSIFMKMSSVEYNVDLKDVKFELPAAVKELVD